MTPDTYIAFLIIECMALPFAFLISPLERVVRSDGTKILVSEKLSTKTEVQDDQGDHDIETDLAVRSLGNLVLLLQVS